jgi:DNA gyrase inhibitor GyrI
MKTLVAALLLALAILVVLAGCKTSRKGYESAPYKVVSKDGKFEVRDYPALTVVETPMRDDSGSSFQRLFRYISGGNADGEKIAMTTPVFMAGMDSQRSMSFVMPADMKSTPAPSDSSVSVATIPAGRFAVFGFSGSRTAQSEAKALKQLREWLDARKLPSSSQPIFGYFDPPWTPPFMRRNEVMLRLDAQASTR